MPNILPNLKFPMKSYSARDVPHDLQLLLYVGGSKLREREARRKLSAGTLGNPELGRLELVEGLHDFLSAIHVGGLSKRTFNAHYVSLKVFFSYVDEVGCHLNVSCVEDVFIAWANFISQRLQRKEISRATACYWCGKVAKSLEDILGFRSSTLLHKTRLGKTKGKRTDFSVSSKYKTFDETREFVSDLLDLIAILAQDQTLLMLPLRLTTALSDKIAFNRGGNGRNFTINKSEESDLAQEIITGNLQSERAFMNLRLLCEFHYFIFYTGVNLKDAKNLELASVQGWVEENGRRFRCYKERKGGEVVYKIYESFVGHYEAYLKFRSLVVLRRPSSLLFPFLKEDYENQSDELSSEPLRSLLKRLGRLYISPGAMRTYLLNDVFDFTGSAKLAANAGQHNVKTFVESYMQPKLEVAAVQWTKFYATIKESMKSVAPGCCDSLQPKKIAVMEHLGAEPNCSNSAGCLFCEQYRGVVSHDYIWALLSYRKLKNNEGFIERAKATIGALSSVQAVLLRVDQIIEEFRMIDDAAEQFYQDALSRCVDDDHHPAWAGYLEIMGLV